MGIFRRAARSVDAAATQVGIAAVDAQEVLNDFHDLLELLATVGIEISFAFDLNRTITEADLGEIFKAHRDVDENRFKSMAPAVLKKFKEDLQEFVDRTKQRLRFDLPVVIKIKPAGELPQAADDTNIQDTQDATQPPAALPPSLPSQSAISVSGDQQEAEYDGDPETESKRTKF